MVGKYELMNYLRRNKDDRGVMAALRCLLIEDMRFRGWQQLAALGGIGVLPVETVAGLYAFHPAEKKDDSYNWGDACRALAETRRRGDENKESAMDKNPFDRRFRRLLACDSQIELCTHLVDVVRGMKAKDIPINYENLYDDIVWWGDKVRERWAIHYWSNRKEVVENVSD